MDLPFVCGGEDCGNCVDLVFDEESWSWRYLIASEGSFLFKKEVLVPAKAVDRIELESCVRGIPLTIGRTQFEHCPELSSESELTQEHEESSHRFFGLVPYWTAGSAAVEPSAPYPSEVVESESGKETTRKNPLCSFKKIVGFELRNKENALGKVVDLVVDISDYTIAFLVVDTRPGEAGGVRLISTTQDDNRISIDVAGERVLTQCSVYHLLESPSADLSEGRLSLGDQQKVKLSAY